MNYYRLSAVAVLLAVAIPMSVALPAGAQIEDDYYWILTEDNYWIGFVGETDKAFERAMKRLDKAERREAAAEINAAAAFLLHEAKNAANKDDRSALRLAAHELQWLAREVNAGRISAPGEISVYFARADNTLARHHRLKAMAHWAKKETEAANRHLKAGARYTARGFRWMGRETVAAAKWTGGEIEGGAKWLGERIETLATEIRPKSRRVEGTVASVNVETGTLTVATADGAHSFHLGRGAGVLKRGRVVGLADLEVGDPVSVWYEVQGDKKEAKRAFSLPQD